MDSLNPTGVVDAPETRPALLVSYVYLKAFLRGREEHRYHYRDWVLDSGAFSAHHSGAEIKLQDYIDRCKQLMASDPKLTEIFALDVIGDWKSSTKNCAEMWRQGVRAIPCFHAGTPESELKQIAKDYPKIALGGAVGYRGKDKWAQQCFARVWPKAIHGFGFGSEKSIMLVPWHSVDATNWEIGPCLAGDSLVSTGDGLRRIDDLVALEFTVNTHERIAVSGCRAIATGIRETLAVVLNTGQTIRCTPDHRVLTDAGWSPVGELGIGSRVRIADGQLRTPVVAESPLDEMLGWMLGDGWFTQDNEIGILFADDDREAMDKLLPVWDEFVGGVHALGSQGKMRKKSCGRKAVLDKFRALGFKPARATAKELPSYILTAAPERQLAFLRGLFSADGGLRKDGSGLYRMIAYACSSRVMIRQVQILMLDYGIQSHINWQIPWLKNEQGQLIVSGESAKRFMAVIGFNLSAKRDKFQAGNWCHSPKEYASVIAVEDGIAQPVYDVVMPSIHHFVANGIVVHNCKFGRWNAFGNMSVRGSKQNLRAEVEWYLALERRARLKWKGQMAELMRTGPDLRLAVSGNTKSDREAGLSPEVRLAFSGHGRDGVNDALKEPESQDAPTLRLAMAQNGGGSASESELVSQVLSVPPAGPTVRLACVGSAQGEINGALATEAVRDAITAANKAEGGG